MGKKEKKSEKFLKNLECGNTEAEGFICRFPLATGKHGDEKEFSRGKRPAYFSGKGLFEAVLPQGKAVNVAARLYHRTPNHFFRQYISPNVPSRSITHVAGSGTAPSLKTSPVMAYRPE